MTKIIKVSIFAVLGFTLTVVQANQMQKYEVKSAKIEYELKSSGDIMGMVTVKSIGKKRVIFDDYGVKSLEEKSEVKKEMAFAKSCFGSADTLKEANICVDKGNRMFDDDMEHFRDWTQVDKNEMLQDMAQFEKMLPCVEAAQTMDAIQKCIPRGMR